MTRLFCVGIVVAAVLFAVPALASVPFPDNCDVTFTGNLAGTGIVLVCPQGDETGGFSALNVTVRDQFNLAIPGQLVTVAFSPTLPPSPPGPGGPGVCVYAAISGTTDAAGFVHLSLPIGTDNTVASAPRVGSGYTVSCMGVTVGTGTVAVMSPDMNCNPNVDGLDFAMFALEYGLTAPGLKCDFDNDGTVGGLDFALFALHWLD
jgi:hypothetical protein